MAFRRFEYHSGQSHKFWEVETIGERYTARWGRIGNKGSTQSKTFYSSLHARAEANKKISEKLSKGYTEVTGKRKKTLKVVGEPKEKKQKPINDLDAEDLILD